MNRRDFIKAALAIPAIAALPAPLQAAEELLEGITYISQSFINSQGIGVTETWRRAAGKIWCCIATEDRILLLEERPYCPWIKMPNWAPIDTTGPKP